MTIQGENMPWEKMLKELDDGQSHGEIPHLPPENITTQQLFLLLVAQNARISTLTAVVSEVARGQKDIVETWKTAGNILRFVKLVGGFGTAVIAFWAFLKMTAHFLKTGTPPS